MHNPSPIRSADHTGEDRTSMSSSHSVLQSSRLHARHTFKVMTVLISSVLLLSACNPIASQHITLSSVAASGTGAGMMRPLQGMQNAGMRELANPDAIGRVLSVSNGKMKIELMESKASGASSDGANTVTPNTEKGTTHNRADSATQKNATNYTTTGESKTITLSDEVQISEMSTLMERSENGRADGRSSTDPTGDGNSLGAASSRSHAKANGGTMPNSGISTDPAGSGSRGGAGMGTMMPGSMSDPDPSTSNRPQGNALPDGDTIARQAEIKVGDIVMVWYEADEPIAKRIVILPMQ